MPNKIYSPIDAIDDWFAPTSEKVRMVKIKRGKSLSMGKDKAQGSGGVGRGSGAGRGLEVARQLAKKTPQVMVKISGGGKGMKDTHRHLDYISRNGQLELIDQDGRKLEDREAIKDLKDEWRALGVPEESSKRECFNVVLGMPAGTPPEALRKAAEDFAAQEFAGHKYVMALHEPNSDERTKNPHVHLCVVAAGEDGRRLNPRKADLRRWRESFAETLRERGVDAMATTRRQHLQRQGPEGFKARKKRERLTEQKQEKISPDKMRTRDGRKPDYEQPANRNYQRAAAIYQSRNQESERRETAQSFPGVRNLPARGLVSDKRTPEQRAAAMLLQQNAPCYLGRKTDADTGMRRARTGADRDGTANERGLNLSERKRRFEAQLKDGARILQAAAKDLKRTDPSLAAALRKYAVEHVGVVGPKQPTMER
jgi:hypothetical protein